jgi:hypothetical protein
MGASFDKKEFKRNLAGSGSYPPVYGSTATLLDGCMVHVDGPDIGGSHRGV